jgi:hypothetical protein
MRNPVKVIMCPACEQKFRNKSVVYWFENAAQLWSDGYLANDIAHEIPLITRCDECFAYFWLAPVDMPLNRNSQLVRIAINPLDLSGDTKFRSVRKLTPEEFAEALAFKKYSSTEEERYLRTHLWWAINDTNRKEQPEEISHEMQALFDENLETLIYKTEPDCHDHCIQLAEMHRELGLFNEAGQILLGVNSGNSLELVRKMRLKIGEKDRKVFQV